MKNIIYASLISVCVVLVVLVLGIYYTQDFTEELSFADSLSLTNDFESDYTQESINFIEAKIGTLELENNGYFEESYDVPVIIGCLNLREGSEVQLPESKFQVSFGELGVRERNIKIPVGSDLNYDLVARYSPPYASISFNSLRENVVSISLYSSSKKESSPFGNAYYENIEYLVCNQLLREKEPLKLISLLA